MGWLGFLSPVRERIEVRGGLAASSHLMTRAWMLHYGKNDPSSRPSLPRGLASRRPEGEGVKRQLSETMVPIASPRMMRMRLPATVMS